MKRSLKSQMITVCAALVLIGAWSGTTLAYKPFVDKICETYTIDKEQVEVCKICHDYKKELNQAPERKNLNMFGKKLAAVPSMKPLLGKDRDYQFTDEEIEIMIKALQSLDAEDTDGDGATNAEELRLHTNPADPKSTPTPEALAKFRKEQKK